MIVIAVLLFYFLVGHDCESHTLLACHRAPRCVHELLLERCKQQWCCQIAIILKHTLMNHIYDHVDL